MCRLKSPLIRLLRLLLLPITLFSHIGLLYLLLTCEIILKKLSLQEEQDLRQWRLPPSVPLLAMLVIDFIVFTLLKLKNVLSGPAPAAAKAPEKPKEEVVDALEGGMDMFGGGGGGGDY